MVAGENIRKGSGNMSEQPNGLIEMMADEIAELKRRLRKVEVAQGYTEMGEMATGGAVPDRQKEYERAVLAAAERVPMNTPCEWVPDKSPQQRRDEAVERAKADIDELNVGNKLYKVYPDGTPNMWHKPFICLAEFIVNKEKRTVVVLLRGRSTGQVRARGIAKCAPTDCFNAHLGRAIALRRALGLNVPVEYGYAPQPTEVRVGDIIYYTESYPRLVITDKTDADGSPPTVEKDFIEKRHPEKKIIDDSRESEAE